VLKYALPLSALAPSLGSHLQPMNPRRVRELVMTSLVTEQDLAMARALVVKASVA
jgi:hypothetical protein